MLSFKEIPTGDFMREKPLRLAEGVSARRGVMRLHDQVQRIVLSVLADLNIDRPPETQIAGTGETRLLGADSGLDSLELVRMLLDVEDRLSREFNTTIELMDERAMSQERSPFRTVNTLTDYIVNIIEVEHV